MRGRQQHSDLMFISNLSSVGRSLFLTKCASGRCGGQETSRGCSEQLGFGPRAILFLNINPAEACCHGFIVMHQQFAQVLLHSGRRVTACKRTININGLGVGGWGGGMQGQSGPAQTGARQVTETFQLPGDVRFSHLCPD